MGKDTVMRAQNSGVATETPEMIIGKRAASRARREGKAELAGQPPNLSWTLRR